jgi:succinyl-diaminopimelate desuccinylase
MDERDLERAYSKIDEEGLVELVQELVRIPSPNPPGNERPVAERVAKEMKEIGLDVLTQEVELERWNAVGTIKGTEKGPALMIQGHIDTVPIGAGENWIVEPFSAEIIDGKIYGRGSQDDKGGIAAMIIAAKAIKEAGIELKRDLVCAAVADEEGWMRGVKHLIKSGITENVSECICVDGFTSSTLKRWFPGRTYGYIHVLGRTAHSGTYPPLGVGINAIHKAGKLIREIDSYELEHPEDPIFKRSHWHCLMIEGGWDPKGACVVPDKITVALDSRLVTGHDPDDIWRQLNSILDKLKSEDKEFNAEIEVAERRPSWEISMEEPLIKAMHAAYEEVLGIPPQYNIYSEYPSKGTMDLHWLAYEGIKCQPLVSSRPNDYTESRAHRENEFVLIEQLQNSVKILISSILRLCT